MSRGPLFPLPCAPDDVARHALAAYYRAVGDATAPIDDPDPANWSCPEDFLTELCDTFELRLRVEAAAAGHAVEAEPDRFARLQATPLHRDMHISHVDPALWAELRAKDGERREPAKPDWAAAPPPSGAGQRPAAMAHGCAAVDPAVGPAPESLGARQAASVDPFFAVRDGKNCHQHPISETEAQQGRLPRA